MVSMKIERTHTGGPFWAVRVDANELSVESGKRLPYPTTVGLIDVRSGKIHVWTPAASKPRGYPAAARALLEQARDQLAAEGKLKVASPKAARLMTTPDPKIRALPRRADKRRIPVARGAVVNVVHPRGGFKDERVIVVGVAPADDFSRAYGRQVYVCDARGLTHARGAARDRAGTVSISEIGAGDAIPVGRVKKIPKACMAALQDYKRSYNK